MEQSTLSRTETGARSNTSRDTTLRPNTPLHPLLKLQQAVGNRAVQRMIRSVSVRAAQEVDGARPFAAAHIAESVGDASRQRLQQPRTNVRHAIQRSPDSNADREAAIKEYEAYERQQKLAEANELVAEGVEAAKAAAKLPSPTGSLLKPMPGMSDEQLAKSVEDLKDPDFKKYEAEQKREEEARKAKEQESDATRRERFAGLRDFVIPQTHYAYNVQEINEKLLTPNFSPKDIAILRHFGLSGDLGVAHRNSAADNLLKSLYAYEGDQTKNTMSEPRRASPAELKEQQHQAAAQEMYRGMALRTSGLFAAIGGAFGDKGAMAGAVVDDIMQGFGGLAEGGGNPHETSSPERDPGIGEPMVPEPPVPTPDPVERQDNSAANGPQTVANPIPQNAGAAAPPPSPPPLRNVPANADIRVLTPDSNGGAQYGVEYRWTDQNQQDVRWRAHGPDSTAPPGTNAHSGDVYRVQIGKRYMDPQGTLHPRNVHNPNSPHYNPQAANDTHIPLPRLFDWFNWDD